MGGVCSAESNKKKQEPKNVSASTEAKNCMEEENKLNNINMKIDDQKIENGSNNKPSALSRQKSNFEAEVIVQEESKKDFEPRAPTVFSTRKNSISKKNYETIKKELKQKNQEKNLEKIDEDFVLDETNAENMPEYERDSIETLEQLGKGGFGEVWRAFDKHLKKIVVLKFLNRYNGKKEDVIADLILEVNLLRRIENIPNFPFLKLLSTFLEKNESKKDRYVLEIESGDIDLKQLLDVRNSFTIDEAAYILMNLAKSYDLLEENGIAHCDVKPDNVILSHKENDNIIEYIISDFGISISKTPGEKKILCMEMLGMTRLYAAPEVKEIEFIDFEKNIELQKKEYDPFLADVYSLGVLLLKLLNTKFEEIANSKSPLHILINQMLSIDPSNRPRFAEIFKRCSEIQTKIAPKGIQDNIIEYRKFMEQKKYFDYLCETFYKYLELNIENQAQLYLDTLKSAKTQKSSQKIRIEIACGDFILCFKKSIEEALTIYLKALSVEKINKIHDDEFYAMRATAKLRIINMFDLYKLNKNSYKAQKNFSDSEITSIVQLLEHGILEISGSNSVMQLCFNYLGQSNMAIHKCLSEGKINEIYLFQLKMPHLSLLSVYHFNNLAVAYVKFNNNPEKAIQVLEMCHDSLRSKKEWRSSQKLVHISIFEENKNKIEKKNYNDLKFIFLFGNTFYEFDNEEERTYEIRKNRKKKFFEIINPWKDPDIKL